jgi:hypothetical protein
MMDLSRLVLWTSTMKVMLLFVSILNQWKHENIHNAYSVLKFFWSEICKLGDSKLGGFGLGVEFVNSFEVILQGFSPMSDNANESAIPGRFEVSWCTRWVNRSSCRNPSRTSWKRGWFLISHIRSYFFLSVLCRTFFNCCKCNCAQSKEKQSTSDGHLHDGEKEELWNLWKEIK